ncbi:MAG: sulfocyanin-like copper-binding protein [Gemmatimonadales bacterium]
MRHHLLPVLVGLALVPAFVVPERAVSTPQQPAGLLPIDPEWMSFDPGTRTVRFKLTAGLTPLNGALNFNGFRDGGLTLTVPVDWTVAIEFENHDGMLPHSAQVIPAGPVPTGALDKAAITRASTDKSFEGLPPQSKDKMRFTARPAGDYLIFCGVPGHGLAGMWIRLVVSAGAEGPALAATPKVDGH